MEKRIAGFGELLLRLSPQGHEDLIVQSDALEMDREYQEHCEHFFKGKPHKRHRLLGK